MPCSTEAATELLLYRNPKSVKKSVKIRHQLSSPWQPGREVVESQDSEGNRIMIGSK
jgi:hypothetical protein